MRHAGCCAISVGKLSRRGAFCSTPRIRGALLSVLCLCFFSVVPQMRAAQRRITQGAVPQASVDPRQVRLPVIDGTDIRFARLSTADGLSQTRVAQIVQDDQGFMWFGTQYGLNRYDGYKVRVFVHDPQSWNSLGCAFVTALFKDRSGTLWVGCDQVLDRFDPATETFTHYQVEPADSEDLGAVVHISQDRTGMLWLATGTGSDRFDPATGGIKHFRHNPDDPSSVSTNDIKWA